MRLAAAIALALLLFEAASSYAVGSSVARLDRQLFGRISQALTAGSR